MTTSILSLKKDPFAIIMNFVNPRDWGRCAQTCKVWNGFIKNNPSINQQITILQRLPKTLLQNLPNRKLPILHIEGEPVDADSKRPLIRIGGKENWATNRINHLTTEMMLGSIMLITDSLDRVGVAIKYKHQIELRESEERVIALHEFAKDKKMWTSGQDLNNKINAISRVSVISYDSHNYGTALLSHLFKEKWDQKEISNKFLINLLNSESCGILDIKVNGVNINATVRNPTKENFIRLSP